MSNKYFKAPRLSFNSMHFLLYCFESFNLTSWWSWFIYEISWIFQNSVHSFFFTRTTVVLENTLIRKNLYGKNILTKLRSSQLKTWKTWKSQFLHQKFCQNVYKIILLCSLISPRHVHCFLSFDLLRMSDRKMWFYISEIERPRRKVIVTFLKQPIMMM